MIPYAVYRIVHFFGIFLLFVSLGGLAFFAANGGTRETNASRKLVAALHGVAAFLVLLGGFGLLARLGVMHGEGFPGWVWAKLGIWALLGAAIMIPYRTPALARPLWMSLPVLGGMAAYLAIYKPF